MRKVCMVLIGSHGQPDYAEVREVINGPPMLLQYKSKCYMMQESVMPNYVSEKPPTIYHYQETTIEKLI